MTHQPDDIDELPADSVLADAVQALRAPVAARAEAISAIGAAIRAEPKRGQAPATTLPSGGRRQGWRWLVAPRAMAISPLQAAAALMIVALGASAITRWVTPTPAPGTAAGTVVDAGLPDTRVTVVRFTLRAPDAQAVALVGDFNAWNPDATRLERTGDTWVVLVPVLPGRHQYGFVVDGTRWIADPAAPSAPDDDFGSPNSILFVGS